MMRAVLTIGSFAAVLLFPWPVAALVALLGSLSVPLLPLSAGLFADTLYFAPGAFSLPFFTLAGAVATTAAYLVRSQLSPDIIER